MADLSILNDILESVSTLVDDASIRLDDTDPDDVLVEVNGESRTLELSEANISRGYVVSGVLNDVLDLGASDPETRLFAAGRVLAEVALEFAPAKGSKVTLRGAPLILALVALFIGADSVADDGGPKRRPIRDVDEGEDDDDVFLEDDYSSQPEEHNSAAVSSIDTAPPHFFGGGHPQYNLAGHIADGSTWEDLSSGRRYVYRNGLWERVLLESAIKAAAEEHGYVDDESDEDVLDDVSPDKVADSSLEPLSAVGVTPQVGYVPAEVLREFDPPLPIVVNHLKDYLVVNAPSIDAIATDSHTRYDVDTDSAKSLPNVTEGDNE